MTSPQAYRVEVRGGIHTALVEELEARFDLGEVATQCDGSLVMTGRFDQSSLRALLELIWDVGGAAVSVTTPDGPITRSNERRRETNEYRTVDTPERARDS